MDEARATVEAPSLARDEGGKGGRLREVAGVFLRLGLLGFGGPAAHIAMMEDELVRRRSWLSRDRFMDLLGATNLIPGPNSTEMAIHLGRERAGWKGLVLGGVCFIGRPLGLLLRRRSASGPSSCSF